jgi:drug/metabolite transporter (DMT)-like permease
MKALTSSNNQFSNVILAILILILGNLFATFVDVIVKALAADVSVYQYLLFRQVAVLLLILPFWLRLSRPYRQPGNLKVHTFRALMTNIGAPCAVMALLYLPLATANVIFYAAPMITLVMASLIFKEQLTRQRLIVTSLGFAGVAIALRPEYLGLAGLLAFCTAFAVAAYNLSVKWLPNGSSTISTIFWSNLLAVPLIGLIAAFNWQPITQDLLILSLGSCICLMVYQWCCIVAFQKADAGAIAVAEYSGLVFAAALGWLIFKETLDVWTLLGVALIILPIIWQSRTEFINEKLIEHNLKQ